MYFKRKLSEYIIDRFRKDTSYLYETLSSSNEKPLLLLNKLVYANHAIHKKDIFTLFTT